jgi:hypothetical protein
MVLSFAFVAGSSLSADVWNATAWRITHVDVDYVNKWVEVTLNLDVGPNQRYWFSIDPGSNPYYEEMLAVCIAVHAAQTNVVCRGDEQQQYHVGGAGGFALLKRITLGPS